MCDCRSLYSLSTLSLSFYGNKNISRLLHISALHSQRKILPRMMRSRFSNQTARNCHLQREFVVCQGFYSIPARYLQSLLGVTYPKERCRGWCTWEHSTSRMESVGRTFFSYFWRIGQDRQRRTTAGTNLGKTPTRNILPKRGEAA